MMKRLTAILLAMAMLVACLPCVVFADDEPQGEPQGGGDVIEAVQDYVHSQEILEHYSAFLEGADGKLAEWETKMNDIASDVAMRVFALIGKIDEKREESEAKWEAFVLESPEKLEGYLETLNEYVAYADSLKEEYADNPEMIEAIDRLVNATKMMSKIVALLLKEAEEWVTNTAEKVEEAKGNAAALVKAAESAGAAAIQKAKDAGDALIAAAQQKADKLSNAARKLAEALLAKVKEVKDATPEQITEWKNKAAALINEAKTQAEALIDEAKAQAAAKIAAAVTLAKELLDKAKAKGEEGIDTAKAEADSFCDGLQDKAQEILLSVKNKAAAAKEAFAQAKENIGEAVENSMIADALKAFIEKAQGWAQNAGLTKESLEELLAQSEELQAILTAYKEAGAPAALSELVAQAKKVFQDNANKVIQIAEQGKIILNAASKALLAKLGINGEGLKSKLDGVIDLVKDMIAYAIGYASGKSYQDLITRAVAAEIEVGGLKTQVESLGQEVTKLEKTVNQKGKDTAELENTVTVTSGKPTITSAKTKAGKKITINWTAIKGAKVDSYQVKIGNKKFTVSAKTTKLTQKNKNVKKILKSLKKGTKVKIYVRAIRKVGTKNYFSDWSKAKKVTIK